MLSHDHEKLRRRYVLHGLGLFYFIKLIQSKLGLKKKYFCNYYCQLSLYSLNNFIISTNNIYVYVKAIGIIVITQLLFCNYDYNELVANNAKCF